MFSLRASVVVRLGSLEQEQAEGLEALAVAADVFGGIGGVAFDGKPDVAVEGVLVDAVGLGEVHFLEFLRPGFLFG